MARRGLIIVLFILSIHLLQSKLVDNQMKPLLNTQGGHREQQVEELTSETASIEDSKRNKVPQTMGGVINRKAGAPETRPATVSFIGPKGTGKSTILGAVLNKLNPKPEYEQIIKLAEDSGRAESKYAWLVDTSAYERDGKGEDTHRVRITFPQRALTVLDTRGVKESKEWIKAVSMADSTVLFLRAPDFLKSPSLITEWMNPVIAYSHKSIIYVLVNCCKDEGQYFDTRDWVLHAHNVYGKKKRLINLGIIPINPSTLDNVLARNPDSTQFSYYDGPTLLEALDTLRGGMLTMLNKNMRIVVDKVERREDSSLRVSGEMVSGRNNFALRPQVNVCPSGFNSDVENVEIVGGGNGLVKQYDYFSFNLKDYNEENRDKVQPGMIISLQNNICKPVKSAEVRIYLNNMADDINHGDTRNIVFTNRDIDCYFDRFINMIDNSSNKISYDIEGSMGRQKVTGQYSFTAEIAPQGDICFDSLSAHAELSGFVIRNTDGRVVGYGYVNKVQYRE